jgi:hypothetical protein
MSDAMFEETDEIPAGRKARSISPELWDALAKSAANGKAYSRTASETAIDELRKDLGSAAVRAKYDVTTRTQTLENGMHKLTFTARSKTPAPAPAPAAAESSETPEETPAPAAETPAKSGGKAAK